MISNDLRFSVLNDSTVHLFKIMSTLYHTIMFSWMINKDKIYLCITCVVKCFVILSKFVVVMLRLQDICLYVSRSFDKCQDHLVCIKFIWHMSRSFGMSQGHLVRTKVIWHVSGSKIKQHATGHQGHLAYVKVIWYVSRSFGTHQGHLVCVKVTWYASRWFVHTEVIWHVSRSFDMRQGQSFCINSGCYGSIISALFFTCCRF